MIIKNNSINYHTAALAYCERGGHLITSNKCIGSASQIARQMESQNELNTKCKKQYVHIKVRFAPEDFGKLTEQDITAIGKRYLNTMNLKDNAYAIYMHKGGTPEEHIHIVASRIKPNNLAAPDEFTYYRNNDFCRTIEQEYKLRELDRYLEKAKIGIDLTSSDQRLIRLKEIVDDALLHSTTMDRFKELLSLEKISVRVGRGISFSDEDDVIFKGSKLGRDYSLVNLEKKLDKRTLKSKSKLLERNNQLGGSFQI